MSRALPAVANYRTIAVTASSALAVLLGLICLSGYAFQVRMMVTFLPGLPITTVTSAVGMCLLGLAIATRRDGAPRTVQQIGTLAALFVVIFEILIVFEHLGMYGLNLDRILFGDVVADWWQGSQPGRQSPHTAICYALFGMTILTADARVRRYELFRLFAPLSAIAALASALGQAYGVLYLYGTKTVNGISLPSVLAFLVLAFGCVMLRPYRRPVNLFFSEGVGGRMTRRLLPSSITVLVVVAVLISLSGRSGGTMDGLAVMIAIGVMLTVMYVALLRTATVLEEIGTEQQQLTDGLTQERDLNTAILDALWDGVVATERDGTVVAVNDGFCEMIQTPAGLVIGQRPPYTWSIETVAAGPDRTRSETQIRRADGTPVDVAQSMSATVASPRGTGWYVISYRDLTERNAVRAEQRTVMERLDHFFNLSSDLLCIAGFDGYFKHVNPAWERVLGHRIADLLDQPYWHFVHPDDWIAMQAEIESMQRATQASFSFENRYRHADGSYRWLNWTSTPSPAEGLVYAVARDVTEERARRDARAQLAAIVESTDDAVISKTVDGVITNWNAAAERIYGYTAQEAIGKHVSLIYPLEQLCQAEENLKRAIAGTPVKDQECIGIRKDGSTVHLSLTISPLRDADGTVTGASCISRDISDRMREQEALAAARDQALAADRAKSEFVAMVSHEIRTPLNGIIGLNTLMLRTGLQQEQQRFAEGIATSAKALLCIVNDVLDFSKIEAGKVELHYTDFDLNQVIADAVRVAAETARDKNIDVTGYYPPELLLARNGDAGRLRQVLLNLLGNAVKFTNDGEVRLEVTPAPDGDGRCRFAVTDTGIGIEPDILQNLFDPFIQGEQGSNRTYAGTGLGLTISRQLVELMGGQIVAHSVLGQGSTFSFTLAMPSAVGPPKARPPLEGAALIGRHLFLADHNATTRAMLAEHAEHWGMLVTEAADLDGLVSGFDVVALDSRLCDDEDFRPGDLDRALRGSQSILMSADPARDDTIAQRFGFTEVIQRPVSPSEFFNCLIKMSPHHTSHPVDTTPTAGRVTGRGRVLVAEDNQINQIVAEELLMTLGYQVDIARNGQEAVTMAAAQCYAAVLMDCQMPKMDGYEATRLLRENENGSGTRLPIIAMTAGAMAADRQRCLESGMDDCVTKPVDPDLLDETLRRWIRTENPNTVRA